VPPRELAREPVRPQQVDVDVMETVAADLVAGGRDLADQLRVVADHLAQDEEGGAHAAAGEELEDASRGRDQLAGRAVGTVVRAEEGGGVLPARARRSGGPAAVVPLVEVDGEDDPARPALSHAARTPRS
jgi:hypothetical protein